MFIMNQFLVKYVQNTARKFNIEITRHTNYIKNLERIYELRKFESAFTDLGIIKSIFNKFPFESVNFFLENLDKSKAQLRQDLIVLMSLGEKRGGYFVEFGATNGVKLSNTHLLEKEYEWDGILAEPAQNWHKDLSENRSCSIDCRCVWSNSKQKLLFNETPNQSLSTIDSFSQGDYHSEKRMAGIKYEVDTVSLKDLLDQHNAPQVIDYLSIDTEGSEYDVLSTFDFNKYKFRVISCEHNFTPTREKVFKLLTSVGYNRKYEDISSFDDWYFIRD